MTRDQVLFYINGQPHRVGKDTAFLPLSDYLRYDLQKTGTKVVCAEGDCGACTILLGRLQGDELVYQAVNSCILPLYQLDCTHIITIEGLKQDEALNPVQEAMVACQGAQCGYCTPGMVVALCGYFMTKPDNQPATAQDIRDTLTGNLCRCTGYEPIIKAGCAVQPAEVSRLSKRYPPKTMLEDFQKYQAEELKIETSERLFYKPVSVEQAVQFKASHPKATLISGGTDIGVLCNKRNFEPPVVMSTVHLPGLDQIECQGDTLVVGARTTLSQLEEATRVWLPELSELLALFGAPQIKNAGTLAGNIANGSPIADTLPLLFVMNAEVEWTGVNGSRHVNINQLYTGYKQMAVQPDELITRIYIPLPQPGEMLKLYKVSRRRNLDISTFTAAMRMSVAQSGIEKIHIAYGGVGPTVLRLPKTEEFLTGKSVTEETFQQAGPIACSEITPLSDVRGSQDFRYQLAENILLKFYHDICTTPVEATV